MNVGDLVITNSDCYGILLGAEGDMHQMELPIQNCYTSVNIACGVIGILLKKVYASEVGTLCDIVIGSEA